MGGSVRANVNTVQIFKLIGNCGRPLSDPVPLDTVVQHWLLATDHDRIAIDLPFESPSMRKNYGVY